MHTIKFDLLPCWQEKELQLGRKILPQEIVEATQLSWDTINDLIWGKTTHFDSHVLTALCQFFGVPLGAAIPFLVYVEENTAINLKKIEPWQQLALQNGWSPQFLTVLGSWADTDIETPPELSLENDLDPI